MGARTSTRFRRRGPRMTCARWGVILACLFGSFACRSRSEPPVRSDASVAPEPGSAIALDDLPSAVTDVGCVRNDAAKVSEDLEKVLASLPSPIRETSRKRFGFVCRSDATVLVALDYGDEALAKRAVLHYAHRFLLPSNPTAPNALPAGDIVRRGPVVAIVAGQGTTVGLALRKERGFVTAVAGYPAERGHGAGSALPFVSKPGAFTAVRQAREYDYECSTRLDSTARVCADLERYEKAKGDRSPQQPETYVGACVPKPRPTAKQAAEEACWLLWSPLGVDVGTVAGLGVKLDGVPLEKLRSMGAAALPPAKVLELRYAILERGPGREVDYVDGSQRAVSADGKESISVRMDSASLVVVRATNDRTKQPVLVAGFARAGGLGP